MQIIRLLLTQHLLHPINVTMILVLALSTKSELLQPNSLLITITITVIIITMVRFGGKEKPIQLPQ